MLLGILGGQVAVRHAGRKVDVHTSDNLPACVSTCMRNKTKIPSQLKYKSYGALHPERYQAASALPLPSAAGVFFSSSPTLPAFLVIDKVSGFGVGLGRPKSCKCVSMMNMCACAQETAGQDLHQARSSVTSMHRRQDNHAAITRNKGLSYCAKGPEPHSQRPSIQRAKKSVYLAMHWRLRENVRNVVFACLVPT